MTWLSEDPWPLAGTFGVLAIVFLIALRVTQQGKYLIWAGAALGLALVVIVVEQLWVTDAERIEAVVYDLGRAVERSDGDAVLTFLTPDLVLEQPGQRIGGPQLQAVRKLISKDDPGALNPARAIIQDVVKNAKFDFLSIRHMQASAGELTRMGDAQFRVYASGNFQLGDHLMPFATDGSGTDWSLGFREVNGKWMIHTITATRLPPFWRIPLSGGGLR